MALYTNARRSPKLSHGPLAEIPTGSPAVLGAIAILLATAAACVATLTGALVLPALALAATAYATVAGLAAWQGPRSLRPAFLTSAGIFALAAMGAGVICDPDQVALLVK